MLFMALVFLFPEPLFEEMLQSMPVLLDDKKSRHKSAQEDLKHIASTSRIEIGVSMIWKSQREYQYEHE